MENMENMERKSRRRPSATDPRTKNNNDTFFDHSICVEAHGSEKGEQRYPSGGPLPPRSSTWRNNLTALSQRRNLYFIAHTEYIYVYQPKQGQTIGSTPVLILTPRIKNPGATGYIVPHVPHAINHILVGDLGSDEILLIATDSGNVSAYRTERIFSTIERHRYLENGGDPKILGSHVECFFNEWVGQSAWGLAIHKLGRLIAVSSNTTVITVFTFALVDASEHRNRAERSDRDIPQVDASEWLYVKTHPEFCKVRGWSRKRRRARNMQLSLTGHVTNIPNVSFLNSELDPHGDWLVSTDINNTLLVWKIWESSHPVSHWCFYPPATSQGPNDIFDDRQSGWNVMALDPRIFRVKRSPSEACGGPPHRYPDEQAPYDLSFLAGRVLDATQYYDFFPPSVATQLGQGPPSDESFTLNSSDTSNSLSDLFSEPEEENTKALALEDMEHPASTEVGTESLSDPLMQDLEQSNIDHQPDSNTNPSAPPSPPENTTTLVPGEGIDIPLPWPTPVDEYLEDEEEYSEDGGDHPQIFEEQSEGAGEGEYAINVSESPEGPPSNFLNFHLNPLGPLENANEAIRAPYAQSSQPDSDSEDELKESPGFSDFPILHFSESHIRMLPGPFAHGPSVVFRAALSQVITHHIPSIQSCDRFNMAQQVPELGIVVAASQKGRVAIMALTEVPGEGKMFRIERILPFASQERVGLRPLCPLLGISVGPVENHLLPPESNVSGSDSSSDATSDSNIQLGGKRSEESAHPHRHPTRPVRDKGAKGKVRDTPTLKEPPTPAHKVPLKGAFKKEQWHGIEYSRRYRIFLTYCDNTILHYELYYDWPSDFRGSQTQLSHNGLSYDMNHPFILDP